jgi:hypothetical protein
VAAGSSAARSARYPRRDRSRCELVWSSAGDVRAWSDAFVSYARQSEPLRKWDRGPGQNPAVLRIADYDARVLTVYEAALKNQSSGRRLTSTLARPHRRELQPSQRGNPGLADVV